MIVVAIMGIMLAMGVPSILKAIRREGMRKAVNDVIEVCSRARARAILGGTQTEVVFHPLERRFEVGASSVSRSTLDDNGAFTIEQPTPQPVSGLSGQLPDDITIEMLDVNLIEYNQSDYARVRFFPNGTSDEMTLILRSPKSEWYKITLEVTTGLADATPIR
jgi:type II secretory pathway pseudopilin PulG